MFLLHEIKQKSSRANQTKPFQIKTNCWKSKYNFFLNFCKFPKNWLGLVWFGLVWYGLVWNFLKVSKKFNFFPEITKIYQFIPNQTKPYLTQNYTKIFFWKFKIFLSIFGNWQKIWKFLEIYKNSNFFF